MSESVGSEETSITVDLCVTVYLIPRMFSFLIIYVVLLTECLASYKLLK